MSRIISGLLLAICLGSSTSQALELKDLGGFGTVPADGVHRPLKAPQIGFDKKAPPAHTAEENVAKCATVLNDLGVPEAMHNALLLNRQGGVSFGEFVCGAWAKLGPEQVTYTEAGTISSLSVGTIQLTLQQGYFQKKGSTFVHFNAPNTVPAFMLTRIDGNGESDEFTDFYQGSPIITNMYAEFYSPLQLYLSSQ